MMPKYERVITVVGANYVDFIVPDLMSKAYEAYKKVDFSDRHFQASIWEHTHATAAIILSVIGIEAYRNRIYYFEKRKVIKGVSKELCEILGEKNKTFPKSKFEDLLTEVFVTRDVIAHNHLYEVKVLIGQDWKMLGHKQRLLEGYGVDAKYQRCVNSRTRKTKLLKLNVQPAKIGFEDLFKVLTVLDLLVGVIQNILGRGYIPFRLYHKIDNHWAKNLSQLLIYYFDQIPNQRFLNEMEGLSKQLRTDFANFLPSSYGRDWFITNTCPKPKCSKLGFNKHNGSSSCSKCGLTIGPVQVTHET